MEEQGDAASQTQAVSAQLVACVGRCFVQERIRALSWIIKVSDVGSSLLTGVAFTAETVAATAQVQRITKRRSPQATPLHNFRFIGHSELPVVESNSVG